MRRLYDGNECAHVEHPEIADAKCTARVFVGAQRTVLRAVREVFAREGKRLQWHLLAAHDGGHQQPFFNRHGNTDVHIIVRTYNIAVKEGVELGVLLQRVGARLDDEVVDGHAHALALQRPVYLLAQDHCLGHIYFRGYIEVRLLLLAAHRDPGDLLSHSRELHGIVRSFLLCDLGGLFFDDHRFRLGFGLQLLFCHHLYFSLNCSLRFNGFYLFRLGLLHYFRFHWLRFLVFEDIVFDNASTRTSALHFRDVDATLIGDTARYGRCAQRGCR